MIDKLLPLIKTQVQFTKLLDKLKGKSHTVTVSSPQERPHFELNLNNSVYSFQLPAFPPLLRKKLSEESPDFHTPAYRSKWRSQIIQVLFDSICLYTWYPSSKQYNGICGALVTKYPFLRDRTGQGYDSWLGMLKNKFKKERIPLTNPDIEYYRAKHGGKKFKTIQASQALTSQVADQTPAFQDVIEDVVPNAVFQHDKENEDPYSVGKHIAKMKEECKKVHPNITILKDKMKRTAHERMELIQSHSTRESLLEFPALNQIFSEIEERYKVDLDKMLLHGLGRAAGKIIEQVSKKKQGTNILSEYEMALGEACEETHKGLKICAAALMLPHLFNKTLTSCM
ncbi:uncharacterized protein LOC121698513 [Alosa sapidissima]|uniref:uncharacterized protein LOC121698513 n=1 Tax=Alosa sapidissima TaxID=34773 RepID=UPI001C08ED98|nr:uncharacterized protein LOC121698513 [Alosa sapidissima]XP_041936620.1 uncharacterized protein LOC121698513 [Alosa sapidissima]XP_041936621.1 uncharacterized protein LOC121698513 [Alosa sapidissima]XP_041936622.1 uncharacterized protein LOC121698513 [Alosa sapidissima]XP_041936624.1 uncharacterized protein LOC121698513 [Alosa sapidissima]